MGVVGGAVDLAACDATVGDGVAVRVGVGRFAVGVGAGPDGVGVPAAGEQAPPAAQDWREASAASVRLGVAPLVAMRATTTATTTRSTTAAARYARRGGCPSG
jgi:hypothetical protein